MRFGTTQQHRKHDPQASSAKEACSNTEHDFLIATNYSTEKNKLRKREDTHLKKKILSVRPLDSPLAIKTVSVSIVNGFFCCCC